MTDSRRFTVLYADDEHANRLVFTQNFKNRFQVETVADGPSALERLARDPAVAVLVADQRMAGMSGTELLRRAREAHPVTQRIMVTAYEDPKPILEALNTGLVMRYVLKPWIREELEAALEGALDLHRLGKEKTEREMRFSEGERFTTLGSIAAGVFQDLKQPLTTLSGSLDLLRRYSEIAAELGARIERGEVIDVKALGATVSRMAKELPGLAEEMQAATHVMRTLNDGARSFLGPDEGSTGDPDAAIRGAVRLCEPQIRAQGTVLSIDVPERGIPRTTLSNTGLTRVLVNVLVHAAHALASRRDGKIELSIELDEAGVRFRVRDDGEGMTPAALARVREPFPAEASGPGADTGLGLLAARRLVDAAGGRMTVESVERQGTTVAIWLPRAG